MNDATLVALIAGGSGIAGAVLTRLADWYGARKLGLGALQSELVKTLQATVTSQKDRIADLETELGLERKARARLEARVDALEDALREAWASPHPFRPQSPEPRRRRRAEASTAGTTSEVSP